MVIFADWASQFDTRPGLAMLSGITTIKPSSLINFAQEESWLLIPVHPCRKTRTGSRSFTVTLSGLVGKNDPGTETVALVQAISSSVSQEHLFPALQPSRGSLSNANLYCQIQTLLRDPSHEPPPAHEQAPPDTIGAVKGPVLFIVRCSIELTRPL